MAPRCGLEGSWGALEGILEGSCGCLAGVLGCSGGHFRQDGSQRPPGGGFEGVCGGPRGHFERGFKASRDKGKATQIG